MLRSIGLLVAFFLVLGLATWACREPPKSDATDFRYPYRATPAREETIKSNWHKVKIGMTTAEVAELLEEPDYVLPLYEPKIIAPRKIGFGQWYLIQRLKGSGSENEKQEKLVRVSFDLDGKVIAVDKWGW